MEEEAGFRTDDTSVFCCFGVHVLLLLHSADSSSTGLALGHEAGLERRCYCEADLTVPAEPVSEQPEPVPEAVRPVKPGGRSSAGQVGGLAVSAVAAAVVVMPAAVSVAGEQHFEQLVLLQFEQLWNWTLQRET